MSSAGVLKLGVTGMSEVGHKGFGAFFFSPYAHRLTKT